MFKMALDRLPSDRELCSQSTISRLENLPDREVFDRLIAGKLNKQIAYEPLAAVHVVDSK